MVIEGAGKVKMLDPWIIEEIRKKEDLDQMDEQPVVEIQIEEPEEEDQRGREEDDEVERILRNVTAREAARILSQLSVDRAAQLSRRLLIVAPVPGSNNR